MPNVFEILGARGRIEKFLRRCGWRKFDWAVIGECGCVLGRTVDDADDEVVLAWVCKQQCATKQAHDKLVAYFGSTPRRWR